MGKQSFLNTGKIPSNDEWSKLKDWIKNNPDLKWKSWDINPTDTKLLFRCYKKSCKNGEHWVSLEKSREIKENQNQSAARQRLRKGHKPKFKIGNLPKRENPLEDTRVSFYNLQRVLTHTEYENLRRWKLENPALKWIRGDAHPQIENLFFERYNPYSYNGEIWINKVQDDYLLWKKEEDRRAGELKRQRILTTPALRLANSLRSAIHRSLIRCQSRKIIGQK